MKLLQDYASVLSGLLKDQRLQEGDAYRLMHFVIQQPVEEGVLLYNVLTRAVALLSPEEAQKTEKNPASVPELVAKWFAVPMDHDDRQLAKEVRAVGKMLENPVRTIKGFTILTTTDCNARCFYCYEQGRRRIPMLEETALKVADFILKNRANDSVKLRWFGGEPLYNKGVISLICGKLKETGVEYKSSMVSNGYLFDDATVDAPRNRKADEASADGAKNRKVNDTAADGAKNRKNDEYSADGSKNRRADELSDDNAKNRRFEEASDDARSGRKDRKYDEASGEMNGENSREKRQRPRKQADGQPSGENKTRTGQDEAIKARKRRRRNHSRRRQSGEGEQAQAPQADE